MNNKYNEAWADYYKDMARVQKIEDSVKIALVIMLCCCMLVGLGYLIYRYFEYIVMMKGILCYSAVCGLVGFLLGLLVKEK